MTAPGGGAPAHSDPAHHTAGFWRDDYFGWLALLGRPLVDVPTASPRDRQATLPPWACRELIATDAARDRLRAWSEAGSPTPGPDDVVRRLPFLGDPEVRSVVQLALLERIAPPAAVFLLADYLFIGTGFSTHGYCIQAAAPGGPVLRLIVLSGASRDPEQVLDVVLHEAAHGWLLPEPRVPIAVEALANETDFMLLSAARDPAVLRDVLTQQARDEAAADALARRWGGRLSCTAEHDQAGTLLRMRRLDATYGGVTGSAKP